jgi:transcriptional antiterminator
MSDIPYSNREIDAHFAEIKEYLIRIEAQTTRTNGRVTKIESDHVTRAEFEEVSTWKSYATGAVAVIVAIILPLLTYFAYQEEQLNVQVQAHLASMK